MQLTDELKKKAASAASVKPGVDAKSTALGVLLTPIALAKKAPKAISTGFIALLRLWLQMNLKLVSPELASLLDNANKPQPATGQRKPIHELMQSMWEKMTPAGMIPRKVPQFVEGVDGETRDIERLYAKEHAMWVARQATTPEQKEKAQQLKEDFYKNFSEAREMDSKDDAIINREEVKLGTSKPLVPSAPIAPLKMAVPAMEVA